MEQEQEMHRHSRDVYCVVCIINQLGDSTIALYESTGEFYEAYGSMAKSIKKPTDANRSIIILVGKIYSSAHYLTHSLLGNDFSYEAYLSVARNLIEKLSLLNHIMKKETRAVALSKQYGSSSFDILAYINADPSQYDSLVASWLSENGWTRSTVESRVAALEERELVLLYAYISRLVHGINRDDMLRRSSDEHYISGYIHLLLLTEINKVMSKIPKDVYPEDLSESHIIAANTIVEPWSQYGGFKAILTLTGFRDEAIGFTPSESETIASYNKKLEEVLAKGYRFYPKIDLV